MKCENCNSKNIEIVTETKQKPRSEWFSLFTVIGIIIFTGLFFLFFNLFITKIESDIELKQLIIENFAKADALVITIALLFIVINILSLYILKPKNTYNKHIIICKDCSAAFELDVAELVEKTKITNPEETKDQ